MLLAEFDDGGTSFHPLTSSDLALAKYDGLVVDNIPTEVMQLMYHILVLELQQKQLKVHQQLALRQTMIQVKLIPLTQVPIRMEVTSFQVTKTHSGRVLLQVRFSIFQTILTRQRELITHLVLIILRSVLTLLYCY